MTEQRHLVGTVEMAAIIGVDPLTLRSMARAGRVKAYRLGSEKNPHWRYDPAEVLAGLRAAT